MTLTTTIPALCALIGLLVALLTSRQPVQYLGLIAFGCGLLVTMMQLAGHVIRL
jgi:hypothetical protein